MSKVVSATMNNIRELMEASIKKFQESNLNRIETFEEYVQFFKSDAPIEYPTDESNHLLGARSFLIPFTENAYNSYFGNEMRLKGTPTSIPYWSMLPRMVTST